eukprot:Skav236279  [mRNA]  locus=scaffold2289:185842:186414:+ [translate_table: standard]
MVDHSVADRDAEVEDRNEEAAVVELSEWAAKEKLSSRFKEELSNIVQKGGLQIVTDKYLQDIGIMMYPMRVKILQACEIKLGGCKKRVRFGAVERFDPILSTRPSGKCVWSGIRRSEKQLNKAAVSAAFKTWRFCATGVDGEEDAALVQDSFEAWRSKPPESGMFEQIFQDLLEGIGAFFSTIPCCGARS